MNTRVKSIKQFLDDYKNKDESLKRLTEDSYKYYYQELMKEYIIIMDNQLIARLLCWEELIFQTMRDLT